MHRIWPTTLSLAIMAIMAACGPSATPPPRSGSTTGAAIGTARRAAPTKCPEVELTPKLRRQKKLTRRIRQLVCGLQACYEAARSNSKATGKASGAGKASLDLKDFDRRVTLTVTIDQGGRVEAVRLSALDVPASLTSCIRSKAIRWDFDLRDDSVTYGPFKIRFAP